LLARLQAKRDASPPGLAQGTLDEALELSSLNGDTWWDAEIHRMRGELLCSRGKPAKAIAELRRAVSVARAQEAAMLERRALDSLAGLFPNAP
ncbi:MAG TPA: hypothetical protein VK762_25965, partial [Polyangiaceae bacterium]|nr:hypothetical protein [Polyangiaceae bacterium]